MYLERVDHSLYVGLNSLVGELRAGQSAHALQGQVAQVGLTVLQELAQLITGTHQQVGLTSHTPVGKGVWGDRRTKKLKLKYKKITT